MVATSRVGSERERKMKLGAAHDEFVKFNLKQDCRRVYPVMTVAPASDFLFANHKQRPTLGRKISTSMQFAMSCAVNTAAYSTTQADCKGFMRDYIYDPPPQQMIDAVSDDLPATLARPGPCTICGIPSSGHWLKRRSTTATSST